MIMNKAKVDFGYSINPDSQIDYDANNRELSQWVTKYVPSFRSCMACGSCTATCSAGQFTSFNMRKLQLLARRGELEGIKEEVTKCMLCGKCMLVCPRGKNNRHIILKLKEALEKNNF